MQRELDCRGHSLPQVESQSMEHLEAHRDFDEPLTGCEAMVEEVQYAFSCFFRCEAVEAKSPTAQAL